MVGSRDLWYVALTDLADTSSPATEHSRADVRGLRKLGWNAVLYAKASRHYVAPSNMDEIIVVRPDVPGSPVIFQISMILRLLVARCRPSFVLFRGSSLLGLGITLKLLKIPFGVEINGIFCYRLGMTGKREWLLKLSDQFFMKHAAVLVPVTEQLKALIWHEKGPNTLVAVARNGTNLDCYSLVRTLCSTADPVLHLGFVGTFYEGRGLPFALKIVETLNREGIETRLTLVGDGPLRTKLENMARDLAIENNITFLGRMPAEGVSAATARCDLMLALYPPASRASVEISGISPLKFGVYLALAKPVLLWDGGLIPDADRIPGVFRIAGDPDVNAVAKFIQDIRLCHGREGLQQLGREARQYALDHMTWDAHVQIIHEAITKSLDSIIGRRSSSRDDSRKC